MFCPNCGAQQGDSKRFCTGCGTNLLLVSQVMTGQLPVAAPQVQPAQPPPQTTHPSVEIERQRQMAKGLRMAIFGGGLLAYKLLSIIFTFGRGTSFGFWGVLGFILLGIGISKIVSSRPPEQQHKPLPNQAAGRYPQQSMHVPHPVFSAAEIKAPNTNELEPIRHPHASVTEDETRQLQK